MTTKDTGRKSIDRRKFLKGSASTAALLAAAQTQFPGGAFAQGAGPEVTKAVLGYIALIALCAAAILVAFLIVLTVHGTIGERAKKFIGFFRELSGGKPDHDAAS